MPFKKGEGGRPKGSKNRDTLVKEERRARFDELVSQRWDEVIAALPATYIADQFMEKAKERHEHEFINDDPELEKIADKLNELERPTKS